MGFAHIPIRTGVIVDVAIQIVHYRTPELLEKCLRSIFAQRISPNLSVKVYVLDNASAGGHNNTDAAMKTAMQNLQQRWQRKVTFVFCFKNSGYGSGHNILMETASASMYTLLINPSVVFHTEHDLQHLVDFMHHKIGCGAVGPQLVGANGERQRFDHAELYGWRAWLLGLASHRFSKLHGQEARVAWVSGAAALIRTDLFRQLNGFDKRFFLYREEEDLFHRLRTTTPWQVWYYPKVVATHIEGASGGSFYLYMAPSFRLFCQKHLHPYNPAPRIYEFYMKLTGKWKWGT